MSSQKLSTLSRCCHMLTTCFVYQIPRAHSLCPLVTIVWPRTTTFKSSHRLSPIRRAKEAKRCLKAVMVLLFPVVINSRAKTRLAKASRRKPRATLSRAKKIFTATRTTITLPIALEQFYYDPDDCLLPHLRRSVHAAPHLIAGFARFLFILSHVRFSLIKAAQAGL